MWGYFKMCSKLYSGRRMSWLQPFMMHHVYFILINILYLLTSSGWQQYIEHRGATSVWSTPVRKNTAYKLGLINPASSIFLTRRQFDIKISTTDSQSLPTENPQMGKDSRKTSITTVFQMCVVDGKKSQTSDMWSQKPQRAREQSVT